MSDDFLELGNDLDAIEVAREGAPAIGEQGSERQPKPNLDDIPEFREWKSAYDRRQATLDGQLRNQQQVAQNLETELHRIRMQGLDEVGQLQYELELTRRQRDEVANQRQMDQLAMQRQRDLEDISLATGMPIQQLYEYPPNIHVHELWRVATKWQGEQGPARRQQQPDEIDDLPLRTPNDTVDVAPSRSASGGVQQRLQDAYDKHRKLFNMTEVMEVMRLAGERGVKLKEW